MALAGELGVLRDRALADLNSAHDYYTDTKIAWRIVQKGIAAGNVFTIRNKTTGSVTTHAELAGKAQGYVTTQLIEATFQQFVSIFENFLFDLLRLWLVAYPKSLGGKQVGFKEILELSDKDAITLLVVDKELNDVLYQPPAGWFAFLEEKAKLGCPAEGEVSRFAEIKASRGALVHSRGIAGKTYEKSGKVARCKDGEKLDFPEYYHRESWELIRKLVADIAAAAVAKAV